MNDKDIENKLSELYTEIENDTPPMTFSRCENDYNNGFYRGRLTAMEQVVQKLTDKTGDDLPKLNPQNK